MKIQATIVHQGGRTTVEDFEEITEVDDQQTLRVFYEDVGDGPLSTSNYEDYGQARVVNVNVESDRDGGGGDLISVDG